MYTISHSGLIVTITSDERFFTVRDIAGKPIATIIRPRVVSARKDWEAVLVDGTSLGFAVGPRTAFNLVARHRKAKRFA